MKFINAPEGTKGRDHYRIKFKAAGNVKELLRKLEVTTNDGTEQEKGQEE